MPAPAASSAIRMAMMGFIRFRSLCVKIPLDCLISRKRNGSGFRTYGKSPRATPARLLINGYSQARHSAFCSDVRGCTHIRLRVLTARDRIASSTLKTYTSRGRPRRLYVNPLPDDPARARTKARMRRGEADPWKSIPITAGASFCGKDWPQSADTNIVYARSIFVKGTTKQGNNGSFHE